MSNPVHFEPFGGHHSWDTVRSSIEHGTLWWKPVQLDFWQKSPAWLALNGWMRKNTLGFDFLSTRSALTWSNQHCRVIFRDDCQRIVQAHSFCWVASPSRDQSDSHLLCTHALKGSNPSSNCNRCQLPMQPFIGTPFYSTWFFGAHRSMNAWRLTWVTCWSCFRNSSRLSSRAWWGTKNPYIPARPNKTSEPRKNPAKYFPLY